MRARNVTQELVLLIVDTGFVRYSDPARLWTWLEVPGRDDNLLC
jgi:hypothetical protein